jgi:hypothetical protein
LPRVTEKKLAAATERAQEVSLKLGRRGQQVKLFASILVPVRPRIRPGNKEDTEEKSAHLREGGPQWSGFRQWQSR